MNKVNVIIVYDQSFTHVLMCYRTKNPYKGLYNLVGGKVETKESDLEAAYRELLEETGISSNSIELVHLMNFDYLISKVQVQVFVGHLANIVQLIDELHPLSWHSLENDFFDVSKYAGEGNIGHMLRQVNIYKDKLFK